MATRNMMVIGTAFFAASAVAAYGLFKGPLQPQKVSRFGQYRGYSEALYDGYVRRSLYLPLKDGTELACDVLLPTRHGVPASEPLPVLFTHTPYLRAWKVVERGKILNGEWLQWYERAFLWMRSKLKKDGYLLDQAFKTPWLGRLIKHGYAVVAVERAGTGASSGRVHPSWEACAREGNEILDWIAAQPWSNGKIGMFGESYVAMTQYAAASSGNPHLKAIFPCSSSFDFYDAILHPGGVFNKAFASMLPRALAVLERMVVPVDGDEQGKRLSRIIETRRGSNLGEASTQAFRSAPFRDSRRAEGPRLWDEFSLYLLLEGINRAGIPIYNSNGWYDIFTRDMFLWHANLTAPRRLHIRPLYHSGMNQSQSDLDYGAEAHRWFDYWLKGIDNGIMEEPPIQYYVMGAPKEAAWRSSETWPLAGQQITRLFFASGRTTTVASINDGFLHAQPPDIVDAYDAYTVDYSATSGTHSRWRAVMEAGHYGDMRRNDEKSLTYTTAPLEADVEITGHPVVHLWLTTDAPDVDVFVYLEEVDPSGKAAYITEGNLRASHRALARAPFDNLGLPYQRSYRQDVAPIPQGEPVELALDLLPTSKLFHRGKRIRIAVACADADNFDTPVLHPAPSIRLLRNAAHASFVDLPIIPSQ